MVGLTRGQGWLGKTPRELRNSMGCLLVSHANKLNLLMEPILKYGLDLEDHARQ